MAGGIQTETVTTKIPARMDRLPWTRWHWLIVVSLGTVWILDGLEVTIKGAVGASLQDSIGFSTVQVAGSASIYLFGAISGALFWGYLTDRFGRKKLFIITLLVYMLGVTGTTLAGMFEVGFLTPYVWFAIFRFITGFGIGGEYSAINSAIDELIPARVRGWVDLVINGSYWLGTIVGASLGFVFLNTLPSGLAWRISFGLGGFLAIGLLLLRLYVPESPRWLMVHGREEEAEETVREIEEDVADYADLDELEEPDDDEAIELRERESVGFVTIARTLFGVYPRRSIAGGSIMLTQAFLYNAIFFTYGLMVTTFFGISPKIVPLFLIPFAAGNFLGPLVLGKFFDTIGRKVMIPLTFAVAGVCTIITGFLFWQGWIGNAIWMTVAWVVIFFFASAGASAGYLTISETFPLEIRAMAIAFFYALATGIGGVGGPYLYGILIASERRVEIFYGYAIGGGLMLFGALMHRLFGVEAAQESLEDVAQPLSAKDAEEERGEGDGPDEQAADEPTGRERDEVDEVGDEERERERGRPYGFRPSTTGGFWTMTGLPEQDSWLDSEIEALARALVEDGPAARQELRSRVRARYWGPGRFSSALREAERAGLVRRDGGRYEASDGAREAVGEPERSRG